MEIKKKGKNVDIKVGDVDGHKRDERREGVMNEIELKHFKGMSKSEYMCYRAGYEKGRRQEMAFMGFMFLIIYGAIVLFRYMPK